MTQNQKILQHLKLHGSITPVEAMRDYGCMRLAARIANLRQSGHKIAAELVTGVNREGGQVRFTRYTLEE